MLSSSVFLDSVTIVSLAPCVFLWYRGGSQRVLGCSTFVRQCRRLTKNSNMNVDTEATLAKKETVLLPPDSSGCSRKFSLFEPASDSVADHGLVYDVNVTGPRCGDRGRRYSGNQPLPFSHRRPRTSLLVSTVLRDQYRG